MSEEIVKLKKRLDELEKLSNGNPKPEGAVGNKPGIVDGAKEA